QPVGRIRLQAERAGSLEKLPMGGDVEPFERGARVAEEIERARGGDARVELPEAPPGGVPRIHELRLPALDLLGVDLREALLREDDLAADLQPRRERPALGVGP